MKDEDCTCDEDLEFEEEFNLWDDELGNNIDKPQSNRRLLLTLRR
mgnify:CR=1 FL=1